LVTAFSDFQGYFRLYELIRAPCARKISRSSRNG
jgi:hypothetical protein